MAKDASSNLSPAQLEIMNLVWDAGAGGIGIADLWRMLSKRRKIARNTVQTTVARLHARGMLRARPAGNAFVYTASQPRQRLLGRFVTRLIDNAFGGSKRALMLALLEDEKLSPKEAAEIRELIDRAEAKRKGKTK